MKKLGFLFFLLCKNLTFASIEKIENCDQLLVMKALVHMDEVLEMPVESYEQARAWLLYHGPNMRLSDLGSELLRLNSIEWVTLETHGGVPEEIRAALVDKKQKNPNIKYLLPLTAVAATEIMRVRKHESNSFSHAQMRLSQRNISTEEVQALLKMKDASVSNVEFKIEHFGRLSISGRVNASGGSLLDRTDTVAIVDMRILRQGKSKVYVPDLQLVTVYKDNWRLLRESIGADLVPKLGLSERQGKRLANFLISLDHKHLVKDVDAERFAVDYENLVALLKSEEKAYMAADFYVRFVESFNEEAAYVLRYYFLPKRS